MLRIILLYCLIFSLFIACKEDKDETFPTIILNAPNDNASFNVLESIPIRGRVTDNEVIRSVQILLIDQRSGKLALDAVNFNLNQKEYDLNYQLFISDSLLSTSDYYIQVNASDGENRASAFSTFRINGIPKEKIATIVALDNNGQTELKSLDEDLNVSDLPFSINVSEMSCDSRTQRLWLHESGTERLKAIDLKDETIRFDISPNANDQSDEITDIKFLNQYLYLSTKTGFLQAFDRNGSDVFTYQSPQNRYVREIFNAGNQILVEEIDIIGNDQRLIQLFPSGAISTTANFTETIVGMGIKAQNQDQAILLSQTATNLNVYDFDLNSGSYSRFYSKAATNYRNAIRISDLEYLLTTDDQLSSINFSTNFERIISSNLSSPKVIYDDLDDWVYLASGNQLLIYDYQTGGQVTTYSFAHPIVDFCIRYNK